MSFFFFFRQKTAYELRISDWSSDVCSSDLGQGLDRTQRTVIHSNEAHRARRRPAERVTERRIDTQPLYRRAVFADGQPDMAALVDRDALVPAEPDRQSVEEGKGE